MFRFLLLCLLLASCGVHVTNWQGTSIPGLDTAHYDHLDRTLTHPVQLDKGDLLFLDYAVNANKGEIGLAVKQGKKMIWDHTSLMDTGSVYLVAPASGKYTVNITGHQAAGGHALRYSVTKPKTVSVTNSTNIELFGLLMQLDNGADIIASKDSTLINGRRTTWSEWYALTVTNYQLYKRYDTSRAMQLYLKLQREGIYNDFFVGFLLQVDEVPHAKINALTDANAILGFSPKGDSAEARSRANEFLAAMNDLYRSISFGQYLQQHKADYAQANDQVKMNLPDAALLPIMEHYYRQQFNGYYLLPSLNILTSMGFGKVNWTSRTIYNVFGPFGFQDFDPKHPDMAFNYPEKIKVLTVHEFGHSFANPAVDSLPSSLIKATSYLYEPIKKEMEKRAYPSWRICLYEHVVKAGEYIVAIKLGDTARAKTFLKDAVDAGFIYVPFLADQLQKWDRQVSPVSFDRAVLQAIEQLRLHYAKP
ncbi:MAG: hypothetical protein DI535_04720 [Citrobacter freundii]|nr:MAG: hypothetical protein DI535_04720 [Citrobacter freundii]